ncbi:MAG: DUF6456 domain-containing protein [Rhizomicrobium sp.]
MVRSSICEAEVSREGRRLFRLLAEPQMRLEKTSPRSFAMAGAGVVNAGRIAAPLVREFLRRDWLKALGTSPESYALSDVGLGWYVRAQAKGDPFGAQHRIAGSRRGTDGHPVAANEAESPVGRYFAHGAIDAVQFAAAEKLRRDFTLAQLMPRLAADWSAPAASGTRGAGGAPHVSDTVLAAKQRFSNAMRAVGPGLSDLLFDVCCYLTGLESVETRQGWPRRSAKVVLQLALDRLAAHYGLRTPARYRGEVRSWRAEEVSESPGG